MLALEWVLHELERAHERARELEWVHGRGYVQGRALKHEWVLGRAPQQGQRGLRQKRPLRNVFSVNGISKK